MSNARDNTNGVKTEKRSGLYLIELRSQAWQAKAPHQKFFSAHAPKDLKEATPSPSKRVR
jgi:hypothetical protein